MTAKNLDKDLRSEIKEQLGHWCARPPSSPPACTRVLDTDYPPNKDGPPITSGIGVVGVVGVLSVFRRLRKKTVFDEQKILER